MSTSTSSTGSSARVRDESPALVCRRSDDGDGEVTFFERDVDPGERTTRWITVQAADCVPSEEWR